MVCFEGSTIFQSLIHREEQHISTLEQKDLFINYDRAPHSFTGNCWPTLVFCLNSSYPASA